MLKKILITLFITITIISTLTTIKISSKEKSQEHIKNVKIIDKILEKKNLKEENIGYLIIKKLNIHEPLFDINSPKNNVEEHVTILKESIFPTDENSIVFIAAHSGTGKIAYFEELDELQLDDEIILVYKNKSYKYIVSDIWEEKKNGFINVNKNKEKQLILTTCSPTKDNYQLIVNCKIKE